MAERQIGLRVMLEYGHFVQIAPINPADAKQLAEKIEAGQVSPTPVLVKGHSFTMEGQPWEFSIPTWRVVGMHTFALDTPPTQSFVPNKPIGGFTPQFGRS